MSSRPARTVHSSPSVSAPHAVAPAYSTVIGHGPGRHGARIAARASHTAGACAWVQRITRRRASRALALSSLAGPFLDDDRADDTQEKRQPPPNAPTWTHHAVHPRHQQYIISIDS